MIKKIILGATLSLCAITASAASLTLINNESTQIGVVCNGKTGIPIPAKGKLSLPYFLIAARFLSEDLQCVFTDGAGNTGHAHLVISDLYQDAQIESYDPQAGVSISPLSALAKPVPNITVTLSQL